MISIRILRGIWKHSNNLHSISIEKKGKKAKDKEKYMKRLELIQFTFVQLAKWKFLMNTFMSCFYNYK